MTWEERQRLVEIRRKGKTGGTLTEEEMAFCQKMHRLWPRQYRVVEREVIAWSQRLMNPLYGEDDGSP